MSSASSVQVVRLGSTTLVGVTHVGSASAVRVKRIIESVQPDVIAVELDEERLSDLRGIFPELKAASFQVLSPWAQTAPTFGLKSIFWLVGALGHQQTVALLTDGARNGEMAAAIAAADGRTLALIDRPLRVSMARFAARQSWRSVLEKLPFAACGVQMPASYSFSLADTAQLWLWTALRNHERVADIMQRHFDAAIADHPEIASSLAGKKLNRITYAMLCALRHGSLTVAARNDLAADFTALDAMLDSDARVMAHHVNVFGGEAMAPMHKERDVVMAEALKTLPRDKRTVAIVGAAHVDGIHRAWNAETDPAALKALLEVPATHTVRQVVAPLAGLSLASYGMYRLGRRSPRAALAVLAATLIPVGAVASGVASHVSRIHHALQNPTSCCP